MTDGTPDEVTEANQDQDKSASQTTQEEDVHEDLVNMADLYENI